MSTPEIAGFIQAKYHYNGGNSPRMVVFHDMEYPQQRGAARWCAGYFANPEPGRTPSAHYAVDADEIWGMVREQDGAWHTPGFLQGQEINRFSIGVEHAGWASQKREDWLSPGYGLPLLKRSAALIGDICQRYGIPPVFLTADDLRAGNTNGITSHWECTKATSFPGGHTDPGPNFPWDVYIEEVRSAMGLGGALATAPRVVPKVALAALLLWSGWRLWKGEPVIPRALKNLLPGRT